MRTAIGFVAVACLALCVGRGVEAEYPGKWQSRAVGTGIFVLGALWILLTRRTEPEATPPAAPADWMQGKSDAELMAQYRLDLDRVDGLETQNAFVNKWRDWVPPRKHRRRREPIPRPNPQEAPTASEIASAVERARAASRFRAEQIVRVKPGGRLSGELVRLLEPEMIAGMILWSLNSRGGPDSLAEACLEDALPRRGEWWSRDICAKKYVAKVTGGDEIHGFIETQPHMWDCDIPWRADAFFELVRCGCLHPVAFGTGRAMNVPVSGGVGDALKASEFFRKIR